MVTPSDGAVVEQVEIAGRDFRASRRTAAHLRWTIAQLRKQHPAAHLNIIQTCFNQGVEASAGTHDFDAVFDVSIPELTWWDAQRFLRECGWAAWYRHTGDWAEESRWHIHMISLGYTAQVGTWVPGQVKDYYHHAMGLAGQHESGLDDSWFPPNIDWTVFIYPPEAPMQTLRNDLKALAAARKVSLVMIARAALVEATAGNSGGRLARIRAARLALKNMV